MKDILRRFLKAEQSMAMKKIKNDVLFQQQTKVLSSSREIEKNVIIEAGEKAMVALYGGSAADEGLDSVRYKWFCEKVSKSASFVEPQTLPPTSAAPKYHSLRVFYLVMEWKGETGDMKPEEWGWHITDGK